MDALNSYGIGFGIIVGVLSALLTVFNKQRLEANITLLQTGNDELRKQNADLRTERADLVTEAVAAKARLEEQAKLLDDYKRQNFRQPFIEITKLISNNHTEVVKLITEGMNAKRPRK